MRRIANLLATVLFAVLVAVPASAGVGPLAPIETLPRETPPAVTAASWILYDATFGVVLAQEEPDRPRAMASTTKIMTALLAYELGDLTALVTVSSRAADVGEAEIGLVPGEQLPLGDLTKTLLIRSANDAAMAVAEAVGGTVESFVDLMNNRARALGMANTSFRNPHGLDAPGHYSSARDLLTLARAAMAIPEFAAAVTETSFAFADAPDGTVRMAEATNHLLFDYPGAIGVKTGYTTKAGLVLVAAAERDARRLFAVVMGSEGERAHFKDATALLDYGFERVLLIEMMTSGGRYSETVMDPEMISVGAGLVRLYLAAEGLTTAATVIPAADATVHVDRDQPLPRVADAFTWLATKLGGSRDG